MISDRETSSPDETYEFHEKGDYPVAPSVHVICWSALKNKKSAFTLLCFGLAMLPSLDMVITGNLHASSNKYFLSEALHCFHNSDYQEQESNLLSTLNRLRYLPEEIVFLIWKYMPSSVAKCLISLQTSVKLIERVSPTRQCSTVFLLHGTITVFLRQLHGVTYICGLRNAYQQFGHKSHESQQVQIMMPVVAVSIILDIFGLTGIQYLMKDGTKGCIGAPNWQAIYARCMNITSHNSAEPFFLRLEGDVRTPILVFLGFVFRRLINAVGTQDPRDSASSVQHFMFWRPFYLGNSLATGSPMCQG